MSLPPERIWGTSRSIQDILAQTKIPQNVRVDLRGMVEGMQRLSRASASASAVFPAPLSHSGRAVQVLPGSVLIMLAIPMGFVGVLVILPLTHTTLNVMSLMGVLMLVGIADSNSILIVDFAHKLEEQGCR
jgi:HAE1 family hydrophobic/amphiphilic exporter-1